MALPYPCDTLIHAIATLNRYVVGEYTWVNPDLLLDDTVIFTGTEEDVLTWVWAVLNNPNNSLPVHPWKEQYLRDDPGLEFVEYEPMPDIPTANEG
jgi:hypothetical protein